MSGPSAALIGEFLDAVVQNRRRAADLLRAHPDLLNARWLHGETVLHFVAVEGFVEAVRFLAQRGADVNLVNRFGDSPLVDVVSLGETEIANVLLHFGADPSARSVTHDNPLHTAVRLGHDRLVALLLAAGADARYRTDLGESILDALPGGEAKRRRVIAVLAEHGILAGAD